MCFKFSSNCSDMCCFAHNREEMYMWNTEKYTPFDIQTFCAVNNFKRASIPHLQQVPRPLKGHGQMDSDPLPEPRKMKFPLADTHDFTLGCKSCATEFEDHWRVKDHGECMEDILLVRRKKSSDGHWIKIRSRQAPYCGHTHLICRNYPLSSCSRGREKCHFAHSEEEVQLWNADKFKPKKFTIKDFKKQNSRIMSSGMTQKSIQNDNSNSGKSTQNECLNLTSDLESRYEVPTDEAIFKNTRRKLTKETYASIMHNLLFAEEKHQRDIISQLTTILKGNISCYVQVPNGPGVWSGRGRRFAKITLNKILSSEGRAGYLVQRACDTVLLRVRKTNGEFTEEAYEAPIVTKQMGYGINGLGNDHLYVFVNNKFLEVVLPEGQRKNENDIEVDVWVRFSLNRSAFCAMHYAIDAMSTNMELLFPQTKQGEETRLYDLRTGKLNSQQIKAMTQILHYKEGDPIFILYGAFGTGKTMTLSHTAMHLTKNKNIENASKILICTYSNSAADLFVVLLDEWNRCELKKIQVLRIYGKNRHLSTIPNDVRKYVIMRESAKGVLSPELPSVEDIQYTDIVITTVHTCLELIKLKMKGSFTHIFIDEAGQTFEPELLIPLSLATRNTCVVLAGDVMQMSPQVYSPDAQSLKTSLLQRIFEGYEIESQSQGKTAEPKHSVSLQQTPYLWSKLLA